MNKVFGIGLERTGTTSLSTAMGMLGYRSIHFPKSVDELQDYDFADDITVSLRYRFLDQLYPGSKFILTVRDMPDWLDSCRRWYGRSGLSLDGVYVLSVIYGRSSFDAAAWTEGRNRFEAEVMEYFQDRPDDLLVMNICAGDGWDKLIAFLQCEFPRDNVFSYRPDECEDAAQATERVGDMESE